MRELIRQDRQGEQYERASQKLAGLMHNASQAHKRSTDGTAKLGVRDPGGGAGWLSARTGAQAGVSGRQ